METSVLATIITFLSKFLLQRQNQINTSDENDLNVERQKELTDYDREWSNESARMDRMIAAGLTPAAAAQGIAGVNSSNGVATLSSATSNPISDMNLGDTFMNSKLKESEILVNQAQANQIAVLTPHIQSWYDAQVDELSKRALSHIAQSGLFGEQAHYFKEFAESLKQKRPWEIQSMTQSLWNLKAEYNEILARTREANTHANLNEEKINTEKSVQAANYASADLNHSIQMNIDLSSYELQFNIDMMAAGINPHSNFGQNLMRLMSTNPDQAMSLIDNMYLSAKGLDSRLKGILGENYAKHAKRLGGLYLGWKAYKDVSNHGRAGLNSFTGALGNIIPFAHPQSSPNPIGFGY